MKVLSFGRMQIQKLSEKAALFRGKLESFMSWRKLVLSFFKRLFKELLIFLPFIFLAVFFANLFTPKSEFLNTKENIMAGKNPTASHYKLGQLFFAANDFSLARLEFATGSGTIDFLLNQPDQIKRQIIFWQKLVEEIPSYRDGYIKLFVLNTKIYRDFDAQKFFKRAFDVDPNLSLP